MMQMAVAAGDTVGPFEVLAPLGRGAFSEAFKAKNRETGELVVLKFPDPAILGDLATYERFKRETEIGERLAHPNIQRVLGSGEGPSGPYLILEYAEGDSLRHFLREHPQLPLAEALSITRQIASALEYAHDCGVFHRDVKPENLIYSPDGTIHVVDFGIALLEGARRVTWRFLSSTMGTPDYMSPEQIEGKRGDGRSDLYSLGVILYELLAGRVPFPGDNALSVMSQHVSAPVPPLREFNRTVPESVERITLKLLRKNPADRYQTASQLLSDLAHYQELDLSRFVFEPEHVSVPMDSERRAMLIGLGIGVGFFVLAGLAIAITVVLQRSGMI
ncbi:MAG TPA: serine/threonine-protein kinase [Tepidiformaceae bacterium]|jgi:serine/threonine protein kinase